MKSSMLVLVLFALCSSLESASGFPSAQNKHQDEPVQLNTELVLVDVQVIEKETGRVVGNLKKEDFLVYEDGVRQAITHFSRDELPLSIVLLVDMSSSVLPVFQSIRDGVLGALQLLKPEDEVALVAFASKARVMQSFTKDRARIAEQLAQIKETARVGGGTLLNVGMYMAVEHLRAAANPASRRVVIAVTDNISQGRHKPSRKEMLEQVTEEGATVCALVVKSWFSKTQGAILFAGKIFPTPDVREYAKATGGYVMNADKAEFAAKLTELLTMLRSRHTLAFVSSNRKPDGKFRKLKVLLTPQAQKPQGERVVLARRGYYARQAKPQTAQ